MILRTCKHLLSIQPASGMLAYWPGVAMNTFNISNDREYVEGLN